MQIIIPMTGYGSRFVSAGYTDLKPFIKVLGHPIIEWIVKKMYAGEDNIMFICRKEHLENIADMRQKLIEICPTARIYEIDNWVKLGPVYDVLQASDAIDDEEPVIVNYCDFFMTWDYEQFLKDVIANNCEGAIPCYTGFHPHLIPRDNLYASCKTDAEGNLLEIKEKFSFENDKTKAKHSPGVYYFKKGNIMKKYFSQFVNSDEKINGEFYCSLPYNLMVRDGLKVWCPTNVEFFCQWGTPEDLREFEFWIKSIKGEYECKF
jgi:NDP-sugar pyrophosphorylase family protein